MPMESASHMTARIKIAVVAWTKLRTSEALVISTKRLPPCYHVRCGLRFALRNVCGGGGGIRTHGTRKGTTVFETVPFDHSGTPPIRGTWVETVFPRSGGTLAQRLRACKRANDTSSAKFQDTLYSGNTEA